VRILPKEKMMDEREIAEKAWREGAYAVTGLSPETALTVPNPYAPVVEYTPTNQEITKAVLKTFTEDEMLRYFHKREGALAKYERERVVEELERLKLGYTDPLVAQTINSCVGMIQRMEG
jgi:hypothetical protein